MAPRHTYSMFEVPNHQEHWCPRVKMSKTKDLSFNTGFPGTKTARPKSESFNLDPIYPLVMTKITMEHDHRNSGFSFEMVDLSSSLVITRR